MRIYINDKECWANSGETILTVAEREGLKIPTLCHLKGLSPTGSCRICVVEAEGHANLMPSCAFPVYDGMRVQTNSNRVRRARKTIIELLIANHPQDCLVCVRNGNCSLQTLSAEYGVRSFRYAGERRKGKLDIASPSIERDPDKCILCGRCVRVCNEIQSVGAIEIANRGFNSIVMPAFDHSLNTVACVYCGQCIVNCPVGALREKSNEKTTWAAINNLKKIVVAQIAPAVRVALGEEFGIPPGSVVTGKAVAALRRIGVDYVFDTNFSADLTIVEEANELLDRIKNGGTLPMLTSCSPGWVKYLEHYYPDLLDNLSSCKSPHEMHGAVIKSYWANKMNLDPKDIFVVSIMPCTAKKFEAQRPELGAAYQDVDAVLTTRELARMIRNGGIDFSKLRDENFDDPLGESTGAAVIFGATGGVMEAALRTAYFKLTGNEMATIDFRSIRGLEGVKEAQLNIDGTTLNVAAVSSLKNIGPILEEIRAGESKYHFVEVMACPGGCINGGGQPLPSSPEKTEKRMQAIYKIDAQMAKRCSHQNESIQKLYEEFFDAPYSKKAHELLHTHYVDRAEQ